MAKKLGKLARRYAQAFLKVVLSDRVLGDDPASAQESAKRLQDFAKVWTGSAELSSAVMNPMFPSEGRLKALIQVAAAEGLRDPEKRFLTVLFEKDRLVAIEEIALVFAELADEAAGVVNVQVTSARGLPDDQRVAIEQRLSHSLGAVLTLNAGTSLSGGASFKTAKFQWKVQPEIIGGLIVEYQGKVIDGSVSGRLDRVQHSLLRQSGIAA